MVNSRIYQAITNNVNDELLIIIFFVKITNHVSVASYYISISHTSSLLYNNFNVMWHLISLSELKHLSEIRKKNHPGYKNT